MTPTPMQRPGASSEVPPDFDVVAGVVQRLAVLLTAGLAPVSAWQHTASVSSSPVVRVVADRAAIAREAAQHLLDAHELAPPAERTAWAALAAAWWIAVEVGAPLGATLQRFAASLRSMAESLREVEVALAGPRATSRIVLALPPLGVVVGALLGVDAPRVLFTTPLGWGCLTIGGLLVAGGVRWNRALIRRARHLDTTAGLGLELLAIAVSGGGSWERATHLVEEVLASAGLPPIANAADAVMSLSRAAGVPAAALLLAEAAESRRRSRSEARRRAAELGTQLLLPLGVCILPAFIAVGVVPIVLAIVASSVGAM